MGIQPTLQEPISMYLLKSLRIVHNTIFHIVSPFFLILQIACAVVLFSLSVSYANEHGATVLTIPVATDNFPDDQKKLETLLHHETGLKEPRIYKYKETQCYKRAMQLTADWLKIRYDKLPLFFVKEESATATQLSQYFLSRKIELIESDKHQNDVSFVSVSDKKISNTLNISNQVSSLPFQDTKKSSINLLTHESLLFPLNCEEKKVPITLPSNLWQIMLQRNASDNKKTKKQLFHLYKSLRSTFDKASPTLSPHLTFLEVSNKHHVEHLHQNMTHVSSVIVQTHGQQKVMLMPPISKQHPYHHLLDSTGQFLFHKEIDLSASDNILNNEPRLLHAILYSVHLNPGELLFVPANWFIYRKSLSTSVSMSLNYFSGDTWCLFCFQAAPMQHEYLTQENRTVTAWANIAIQQNRHNACTIRYAHNIIQTTISNATRQVLDLRHLNLTSLPDAISRIPHLKTLNLQHNRLTSFSLSHMKNLVSLDLSNNQLSSFLSCDLPNVTHINLRHNSLSHLGTHCISFINTNQRVTLDLRNNPWSIDTMIHIYEDLSQRSGKDVTDYPHWFLPITHIKRHAITYENFLHLLSQNNISPASQNSCLNCPITCINPRQVIFFVTSNKRYIIYDADALIKWMRTQWWEKNSHLLLNEEEKGYTDPSTREPLTFKNLINAKELCVLQYLKQELGPDS